MCNLSLGIEERAAEKATEKTLESVVMNMYKNKFSLEQISLVTKKSIDEVKKIIEKNDKVLA